MNVYQQLKVYCLWFAAKVGDHLIELWTFLSATSGNVTSHCTHLEVQHVGTGISFPLWTFHPHYCIIHITGLLANGFLPPGSTYVNGS